jgi:hypothetical protein
MSAGQARGRHAESTNEADFHADVQIAPSAVGRHRRQTEFDRERQARAIREREAAVSCFRFQDAYRGRASPIQVNDRYLQHIQFSEYLMIGSG